MISRAENFKQVPINIVGSSTFGRYNKISDEYTYNMFVSDNWMVPYGGYVSVKNSEGVPLNLGTQGRALFPSNLLNGKLIGVFDLSVYIIDPTNATYVFIGYISSLGNPVYIAENNGNQIAIVDGNSIYIYNTLASTWNSISVKFKPVFIAYHDTYFLCSCNNDTSSGTSRNNTWQLSASDDGTSWPGSASYAAANIGQITTKSSNTVAVVRFPSRGNLVFVFGDNVTEAWFDVGYQLFPYQRNVSFSVDYGCINARTIATSDEFVVWLGQNEKSGPIILASDGGNPEKISTDGLDYVFSQLTNPSDSEGFLYRQDGHLFYHINFYTDNLSIFYDFNTKMFYHACDENRNYFIAGDVAYTNNQYYFISKNNGQIYAFDTIYTTYDGAIVPRVRICKNYRQPGQEYFIANDIGFTIETGVTDYQYTTSIVNGSSTQIAVTPRVDLSFSTDGGQTFSNNLSYPLNPIGKGRNMLRWWGLGMCNDFVPQFNFWGIGRTVITDGILNVR